MQSEALTRMAARVAEPLQQVNLDSAWSFFACNSQLDQHPALQAAMRELLQAEQLRRDGAEIAGYPLPAFDTWNAGTMLMTGGALMGVAEVAAMSGDPQLTNLAFRMLQFWLAGLAAGLTKEG